MRPINGHQIGYAVESALLRARKVEARNGEAVVLLAVRMVQVYLQGAMARIDASAHKMIAAVGEGDLLRTELAVLRRLGQYEPVNICVSRSPTACWTWRNTCPFE